MIASLLLAPFPSAAIAALDAIARQFALHSTEARNLRAAATSASSTDTGSGLTLQAAAWPDHGTRSALRAAPVPER